MSNLPYKTHAEFVAMHGVIDAIVYVIDARVDPVKSQCPLGRVTCDSDRCSCRYFGGVINLDRVMMYGDAGRSLCAHRNNGGHPALAGWQDEHGRDWGYGC